ncbi:MAG: anaerobic ribonucleoside-triphosphate reductase activating protein [Oscillospiraceae bacterium]|nr:anaerobic ribonucleoside-triphosphate reductase activating protein [Oscillospiraceae bacterium]
MNRNSIIRIAGIVNDSIVDGPGLRMTIFVQGCPHACEGCHNPHTWDFDGGKDMTLGEIYDKVMANPLLDGVTFSGGEPFCKAPLLYELGTEIKKSGLSIITYTGYLYEYLLSHADAENMYRELLQITDILIDGPFVLSKRDLELRFRGSSNQRVIYSARSLAEGKLCLYEDT